MFFVSYLCDLLRRPHSIDHQLSQYNLSHMQSLVESYHLKDLLSPHLLLNSKGSWYIQSHCLFCFSCKITLNKEEPYWSLSFEYLLTLEFLLHHHARYFFQWFNLAIRYHLILQLFPIQRSILFASLPFFVEKWKLDTSSHH